MKSFIGCKIIKAEPMSKNEFDKHYTKKQFPVKWPEDVPGYHVLYPDNYDSWSPKDVFEQAYRPISDAEFKLINN